jgi:hypothetical protein
MIETLVKRTETALNTPSYLTKIFNCDPLFFFGMQEENDCLLWDWKFGTWPSSSLQHPVEVQQRLQQETISVLA